MHTCHATVDCSAVDPEARQHPDSRDSSDKERWAAAYLQSPRTAVFVFPFPGAPVSCCVFSGPALAQVLDPPGEPFHMLKPLYNNKRSWSLHGSNWEGRAASAYRSGSGFNTVDWLAPSRLVQAWVQET